MSDIIHWNKCNNIVLLLNFHRSKEIPKTDNWAVFLQYHNWGTYCAIETLGAYLETLGNIFNSRSCSYDKTIDLLATVCLYIIRDKIIVTPIPMIYFIYKYFVKKNCLHYVSYNQYSDVWKIFNALLLTL